MSFTALLLSLQSQAEVWSRDDGKVIHLTNIPPKGKQAHLWKSVWRSVPGRGGACKDVVPAVDQSLERFRRYDAYVTEASLAYALPKAFLKAVISVESDFDPHVVSCKGAKGLMQIMPDEEITHHIRDVFDPRLNILGGARVLRVRANQYQGNMALTLASYNAGPGAVKKYNGVPPYALKYVKDAMRWYEYWTQREK